MNGIESLEKRYARHISIDPSGCWSWTGAIDHDGYGATHDWRDDGSRLRTHAHRAIYRRLRGEVGTLPIDHLCRNRRCVNPDHMEPVTIRENTLRGVGITAVNAKKTHCKRGHSLTGDNLRVKNGKRVCVTCRILWKRARYPMRHPNLGRPRRPLPLEAA